MSTKIPAADLLPRRAALGQMALGFGGLALSTLLSEQSRGVAQLRPQTLFPARARRVIFLFMHGGPSHVDLFDYKPSLEKFNGKPLPFPERKVPVCQAWQPAETSMAAQAGRKLRPLDVRTLATPARGCRRTLHGPFTV